MVEVKCILELTFENNKKTVSYTDTHPLESLLDENNYNVNKIIMAPMESVKIKQYTKVEE